MKSFNGLIEWTFATATGGIGISLSNVNEILQTVFISASIIGLIVNISRKSGNDNNDKNNTNGMVTS